MRAGSIPAASASDMLEPLDRVGLPGVEDDHDQRLGRAREVVGDPGAEQRALADPARPVEDGQPGRDQVGGDDLPVALPAEEQRGSASVSSKRASPLNGSEAGAHARTGRLRGEPPPELGRVFLERDLEHVDAEAAPGR